MEWPVIWQDKADSYESALREIAESPTTTPQTGQAGSWQQSTPMQRLVEIAKRALEST